MSGGGTMLDFSDITLKKQHCVSSLTDQCPHIEQGGAPEKCVTLVRGSPREEWVPPSAARAPLPLPRNHPTKNNGEAGRGLCRLSHNCSYTDYLHRFFAQLSHIQTTCRDFESFCWRSDYFLRTHKTWSVQEQVGW